MWGSTPTACINESEQRLNSAYQLVQPETPEDWQALHNLRRSELFARKVGIVYNDNHPDDRAPNHFPLVLKLNGKCVGTARLDLFKSGEGVLRLVAVDPALQRRGHGRILEQAFEELARSKGVSKLFVNANPTAVGYYEKLGFVHEHWEDPAGPRTGFAKTCAPMTKVI
jgi:N-acetylglutamate synthase-like GNAT family acetyltransferase